MAAVHMRLLQHCQSSFCRPHAPRTLALGLNVSLRLFGRNKLAPLSASAAENELFANYVSEATSQSSDRNSFVHPLADVAKSVVVESGAVIQEGARVGEHVVVGAGCVVGRNVTVGAHSTLGCNVVLQNCTVGERCLLHSGVSVGQDGFGFFVDESGAMQKKPQTLGVQIGNRVEIGANSCVDRGSWRDTVIGDDTKIDNLVQIGHNVVIGRCCMLCGQVGVGGSATLGDFVVLAGQAGVADHVSIASKVRVAAKGGVINDIKEAGDYAGFPAVKATEWRRSVVLTRKQGRGEG